MPTINEIRDTIQEHQEYGYTDISLDIAVTLLAEVERLDTDCDRYAGAWKHGQQEIDNLKALVERRDESIDGWIKTLNSCNEELTAAKAEVERLNAIANRLLNDVEIEGYSSAANVYREELKGNQND